MRCSASAHTASPWPRARQGIPAAALDWDNRVIGTSYNGLAPGFDPPEGFWDDRDGRQKYMLHAEVNLCSLFKRGEAKLIAATTMPCTSCMQTLCAYGIKEIYYRDVYQDSDASRIANLYCIQLEQIEVPSWARSSCLSFAATWNSELDGSNIIQPD